MHRSGNCHKTTRGLSQVFNADGGEGEGGGYHITEKFSYHTGTHVACLCPPSSSRWKHLTETTSFIFKTCEADKWHHLQFAQAEDQEKLTDMASSVVCFKSYFIYFNMLGFH